VDVVVKNNCFSTFIIFFQRSIKEKIPTNCRAKYGALPYSSSFFIQTILSVLEFHQINDFPSLSDYTAGGDILPALKVVTIFCATSPACFKTVMPREFAAALRRPPVGTFSPP